MKKSLFTVTCPGAREHTQLLFNAQSGAFACIDDAAFNGLDAFENSGEADSCLPYEAELVQAGFLVADDADELSPLKQAFCDARTDASILSLALAPTYACNCRCAYCYEQDKYTEKSMMNAEVEQAIFDFVEERFAASPFSTLKVEWYGGDPQLCLDLVERMSTYFIEWCTAHSVAYDAMMLSNCTRIGEEEAALLARARVNFMLVTVDGTEEIHNYRRPAVGEENPYQKIMTAIAALQKAGVRVDVMMNTDKVNAQVFAELHADLKKRFGIELSTAKLNDYAHSYGCNKFKAPEFDLYTHEEYAHASFELCKQSGLLSYQELMGRLQAFPLFCQGQLDNYFVIDSFGDVYKCDGWMGDTTKAIGSIVSVESRAALPLHDISFNPFKRDACCACWCLPLCMGNCSWEQERCDWPCHPLLHTIKDYLQEFAAYFGSVEGPSFTLYLPPRA